MEARRRIENGFEKLVRRLPGRAGAYTQRWEGDRLTFSVAAMRQTVSGTVDVLGTAVGVGIELPGLLGQIAGASSAGCKRPGSCC